MLMLKNGRSKESCCFIKEYSLYKNELHNSFLCFHPLNMVSFWKLKTSQIYHRLPVIIADPSLEKFNFALYRCTTVRTPS